MVYRLLILIALLFAATQESKASHIVGGEVYYTCLEGLDYRVRLIIYQDCLEGQLDAIKEDTPAYIGVFNMNTFQGKINQYRASSITKVPANFSNECVKNPPLLCLNRVEFVFTVTLAPNTPYRILYQRCCRNRNILNIDEPETTGASYFIDIPPAPIGGICNTSAVFKNFPPQIICINNPLIYDHSATDADGDSLSYEFCTAYTGGSIDNPRPEVFPSTIPPPVRYVGGHTAPRPMLGNPVIQINPTTGMISGTPNKQGRYVVTVCCHEWRNGVRINTIRREFQFNVTNCSKAVVANMPQFSDEFNTYVVECSKFNIKFINQSSGGFKYRWYFQYPDLSITSTDFEPEYTYPDTGTYAVKLIVNEGSTCPDSITRIVKVYPTFTTDFSIDGLPCPNSEVKFTDLSVATHPPVTSWSWSFGDTKTSSEQNPVHIYSNGGDYKVRLISTSVKGCKDTAVKDFGVEKFKAFAGNDTIIVRGETINFNATGGVEYTWTPSERLMPSNVANPSGHFPDTGWFAYNVHVKSAAGCEGDDSIKILVVNDPYLFMPSAFTPNRDGLNDFLRPIAAGYRNVRFLRVFNRWGQVVFQSNNFAEGWDGTFNGKVAEMGVYFWVLGVTDRFGKEELIKGDITLIR
jgi:gliding motility-associated-like protein